MFPSSGLDDRTAGAIDLSKALVRATTVGAISLANGYNEQEITIVKADNNPQVITPANFVGHTTITFSAYGQTVTLVYNTTLGGWYVKSISGATLAP